MYEKYEKMMIKLAKDIVDGENCNEMDEYSLNLEGDDNELSWGAGGSMIGA